MLTFLKRWVAPCVWLVCVSIVVINAPARFAKAEDDPKVTPKIILPVKDGKVPTVGQSIKLTKGMRYVVEADVKCDLVTFPEGLVTIESKTGPRDWTGIFSGGTGDYEDRTFNLPFIYALAVKPNAKGTVDLLVIPQGYTDRTQWKQDKIDVDGGNGVIPQPPKDPDPPKVDPDKPPMPVGSLYFMVIRPDGSATQEFLRIMENPSWKSLETDGYVYKQFTLTKAQELGAVVGTPIVLPCVVTLRVSPDKKTSVVVRGPVPLPTTSQGIIDLPKGVNP